MIKVTGQVMMCKEFKSKKGASLYKVVIFDEGRQELHSNLISGHPVKVGEKIDCPLSDSASGFLQEQKKDK